MKNTLTVLALDQATQTGWAVGDMNSFEARTVEFGNIKMLKREFMGERLLMLSETLGEIIAHYKPGLIALEHPYWPQPGKKKPGEEDEAPKVSAHILQFLQKVCAVVELEATRHGLPYEMYYPSSWRKTFLGYGRKPPGADADHMKKAAVQKARVLGYKVDVHDEADAIGILMHALHGPPANARAQDDLLSMVKL